MDFSKFFTEVTKRRVLPISSDIDDYGPENTIQLGEGKTSIDIVPVEEIRLRLRHAGYCYFNDYEMKEAFGLGQPQGCKALLKILREMQSKYHKSPRNDWNVLVTTGAQDGLSKILEGILEIGDPIMLQIPSYFGVMGILMPLVPEFIEIEQDGDGILPEIIERVCEQRLRAGKPIPKALYVNPTGANPTGTVLTEARRRKIYALAKKFDFLIIEDDPYYFIHFLDEKPTSFFELDTDGRVVRLDSFSKILSAGLRLGVVTAHNKILEKLTAHTETTVMHPSTMSQVMLCKLFEVWGIEKFGEHLKDVQKFYRDRRDIMLNAIAKHLTGLAEWNVPKGGMFAWVRVTALKDVMKLASKDSAANGVFVLPGHTFQHDLSKPNQYLRLCYSYATPEEIDKALSILAKLIRAEAAMENKN